MKAHTRRRKWRDRARELRMRSLSRRSYENPAVPLTGKNLAAAFSATQTDSGASVDERTALRFGAVFGAVRIRAETLAVMPLKVYRRLDDGAKEEARQSPAWRLLHREPNPLMTPTVFKETLQAHIDTWGNGYSWIEYRGGKPRALWPLDPSTTQPGRTDGRLAYSVVVTDEMEASSPAWKKGERVSLEPSEVLHIPGLGFDGLVGYSPITLARQTIGNGLSAESFRARFFRNGAWMSGVLEHPEVLREEAFERLSGEIAAKHQGISNAFHPLILEEGMKWKQATIPSEDALLLHLGVFSVRDIARIYRIPLHMLADMEKGASFASIEQTSLEFVKYTLGRPMRSWEEECARKLTRPDESVFVEFVADSFLRADTAGRYEAYEKGRNGGWMSVNDIRRMENLPPIEGGDEYLRPLNMGVVGGAGGVPPPDDGADLPRSVDLAALEEGAVRAHRAMLEDAIGRLVAKELDRAQRASGRDKDGFAAWASEFYGSHREHIVDVVYPGVRALAAVVGGLRGSSDGRVERAALDAASALADATVVSSQAELVAAHGSDALEPLRARWTRERAGEDADAVVRLVLRALEVRDV